jgi:hypothetical protein
MFTNISTLDPHHHLIEKDDSVWAQKQGDYSTSPANDQHTNFVPAFDATTGNRYAGQDQAECALFAFKKMMLLNYRCP